VTLVNVLRQSKERIKCNIYIWNDSAYSDRTHAIHSLTRCLYSRLIRLGIPGRRNVMNWRPAKVVQWIQVCFVLKPCVVCDEGQMMLGFYYSRL